MSVLCILLLRTGFIHHVCSEFFFLLQNFLRCQNNKNNYNLVCETLQFLDCICGSTTGGLGLLGLYINQHNVALINQTVESLTEYCQGPCHDNQASTQTQSGFSTFCPLFCNYNQSLINILPILNVLCYACFCRIALPPMSLMALTSSLH